MLVRYLILHRPSVSACRAPGRLQFTPGLRSRKPIDCFDVKMPSPTFFAAVSFHHQIRLYRQLFPHPHFERKRKSGFRSRGRSGRQQDPARRLRVAAIAPGFKRSSSAAACASAATLMSTSRTRSSSACAIVNVNIAAVFRICPVSSLIECHCLARRSCDSDRGRPRDCRPYVWFSDRVEAMSCSTERSSNRVREAR